MCPSAKVASWVKLPAVAAGSSERTRVDDNWCLGLALLQPLLRKCRERLMELNRIPGVVHEILSSQSVAERYSKWKDADTAGRGKKELGPLLNNRGKTGAGSQCTKVPCSTLYHRAWGKANCISRLPKILSPRHSTKNSQPALVGCPVLPIPSRSRLGTGSCSWRREPSLRFDKVSSFRLLLSPALQWHSGNQN